MSQEDHEITGLLAASRHGDEAAFDRLMSLVYQDLRRIAHYQLRRDSLGGTMSTTVLVHEAYMKLVGQLDLSFKDRSHFFAIAARAMRQIVVDYAKWQSRQKRGGRSPHITVDTAVLAVQDDADTFIALDQALSRLSNLDERMTQVVECRFFAGLSERETADALNLSLRTVQRSWAQARVWLRRYLDSQEANA